jgi:hypothetical protein
MLRRLVYTTAGILLSAASAFAQNTQPPALRVEAVYPRHAPRGQTTVISVAVPSPETVQSAEIQPSAGVTVSGLKGTGSGSEQNIGWWEISLDVAQDAAPGARSLVLVLRTNRTAPVPIVIEAHAPTISNLRVVIPPQGAAEFLLNVTDTATDLGESPYVWFTAECGGEPLAGAVRGRVNAGVIRAPIPNLGAETCDLQVRVTDATGIESKTLKTAATLPRSVAPAPNPAPAATASDEQWAEFASREDRFTITFPGRPQIADTTWTSQYGAILPTHVYTGRQGSGRYSVTVVDYNPIERLLCERSRTLPALDLAVHEYGPGYWKTDVRSGVIFAASKYLEKDGKVTNMFANFADLVAGMQLQFTSNADQSRTYASIYMHDNRLVIAEATVPRGYPAPLIFQQSLGWLDDNGDRIRYLYMNYNEPDAPKPPGRGGR